MKQEKQRPTFIFQSNSKLVSKLFKNNIGKLFNETTLAHSVKFYSIYIFCVTPKIKLAKSRTKLHAIMSDNK